MERVNLNVILPDNCLYGFVMQAFDNRTINANGKCKTMQDQR